MPKHILSRSTGKLGVTFVRGVVEKANCLFHKIELENDLGVDALIELIRNEEPLNKQFAVQIKTGESYFDSAKKECVFPVEDHYAYWSGYPIQVYGIVFVPSLKRAFWVDIKRYFKNRPNCTTIRFPATEASAFDDQHFTSVFIPTTVREVPDIPFDVALRLFHSPHEDEFFLGMVVLFRRFCNRREMWDAFVEHIINRDAEDIPGMLIYFLAHAPWHPDIYGFGEQLTEDTREYVSTKLALFSKSEVSKLLSLVDEENMIARGTIGQCVEAIVSSLPDCIELLLSILKDPEQPRFRREVAGIILAMHEPQQAVPFLLELTAQGSWYAGQIVAHVKEWGKLDPYM